MVQGYLTGPSTQHPRQQQEPVTGTDGGRSRPARFAKTGMEVRTVHPQASNKSRVTALTECSQSEHQLHIRHFVDLGQFVVVKDPNNHQTDPHVSTQESPFRHLANLISRGMEINASQHQTETAYALSWGFSSPSQPPMP